MTLNIREKSSSGMLPSTTILRIVHFLDQDRFHIELVADLADQFFEHVLERHQSCGPAVLIHGDSHEHALGEEEIQRPFQRHRLRHEQHLALDIQQPSAGSRLALQLEQVLQVDHPHDVVHVAFAERIACELVLEGDGDILFDRPQRRQRDQSRPRPPSLRAPCCRATPWHGARCSCRST